MPGKARRIASRQAQLSRKRKKLQKGPSGIQAAEPVPAEVDGERSEAVAPPVADSPAPAPAPATGHPSPVADRPAPAGPSPAPSRPQLRARGERPATYNYVGAEVRRILILAGTVLAAIIVLGVIL